MSDQILNPDEWVRATRGRVRELSPDLSTEAVWEAIDGLPEEYGPYALLVNEPVPGPKHYVSRSQVVHGEELREFIERGARHFFLVSTVLSPGLLGRLPDLDGNTLATNGAINLQMGRTSRLGPLPPVLGLVNKVVNRAGEVREHQEHGAIFERAVRLLRKSQRTQK